MGRVSCGQAAPAPIHPNIASQSLQIERKTNNQILICQYLGQDITFDIMEHF